MGRQLAPSPDDNARRDERAVTHRATQRRGVVPPNIAARVVVSAVED